MQGGYGQPMIIENVKIVGDLFENNGQSMVDKVYDSGTEKHQNKNEIHSTITNINSETQQIKVVTEQEIVRMVGRNPENPSNRTVGMPTEQRLELNSQNICNTLTTVQKDNLVLEKNITTLITNKEEGEDLKKQNQEIIKTNNDDFEKYYLSEKGKKYVCDPKRGMCTDINADICQTLTAKGQSNWTGSFVSPDIDRLEKSTNIGSTEPTIIHLKNGNTITSNDSLVEYRIRKLTPRECGRLMGVGDKDIDKMLSVNSNTQAYKQFGNSIVVNCLIAIFSQMGIQGIPRWNDGLSDKYK